MQLSVLAEPAQARKSKKIAKSVANFISLNDSITDTVIHVKAGFVE